MPEPSIIRPRLFVEDRQVSTDSLQLFLRQSFLQGGEDGSLFKANMPDQQLGKLAQVTAQVRLHVASLNEADQLTQPLMLLENK